MGAHRRTASQKSRICRSATAAGGRRCDPCAAIVALRRTYVLYNGLHLFNEISLLVHRLFYFGSSLYFWDLKGQGPARASGLHSNRISPS